MGTDFQQRLARIRGRVEALVQRILPNDIKTIYQGLGDVGVLVVLWVLLLVIAVRGRGKMDYVGMGMMDLATQVLVEVAAG